MSFCIASTGASTRTRFNFFAFSVHVEIFMSNTVEILVKNPSGEGDSLVVIPLASSILDLKHRISQQHPKRPDVASQRLIFSGRILRDDDVLQNIFNPNIVSTEY